MLLFLTSIGLIIKDNIMPIAIIIAIGYILEKRFKFNIRILSKLNFYLFIPCYMFANLYDVEFDVKFIKLMAAEVLIMVLANIVGGIYARKRRFLEEERNHFQNCLVFNNIGNIGVPLVTLLFSGSVFLVNGEPVYLSLAVGAQLVLMTTQNIALNSWGFYKGFRAKEGTVKESIKRMLSIPILYAIVLVILARFLPFDLHLNPAYIAIEYIQGGMIPIALLALGMQVGKTGINLKHKRSYETVFLKVVLSFVLAFFINKLFGFTGVFAQVFMIISMTPTAVNVALVSIEAKSQEEFTSQVVVLSTVIALLIFPFVLYATQTLYPI